MRTLEVHTPGLVSYDRATQWQQRLLERRERGEIPDTLLLLEHPPTITLTRRCGEADLQHSREALSRQGFTIESTRRGGLATMHNPGQLVGYLIFKLADHGRDLHLFLRSIEQALMDVCQALGRETQRQPGKTGVWVGERKLASIGIAVHRWITWHGFALNVRNDLAAFDAIVPCGLQGVGMTSLERELGRRVDWSMLLRATGETLGREFDFERVTTVDAPLPPAITTTIQERAHA